MAQRKILAPTEAQESIKLVQWCNLNKVRLVHVPNEGHRSMANGHFMKRIGLRTGFPDYFLFIKKGSYGGLAIELKRTVNAKLSDEQRFWIDHLNAMGYNAHVCKGADAAIAVIENYLKLEG